MLLVRFYGARKKTSFFFLVYITTTRHFNPFFCFFYIKQSNQDLASQGTFHLLCRSFIFRVTGMNNSSVLACHMQSTRKNPTQWNSSWSLKKRWQTKKQNWDWADMFLFIPESFSALLWSNLFSSSFFFFFPLFWTVEDERVLPTLWLSVSVSRFEFFMQNLWFVVSLS